MAAQPQEETIDTIWAELECGLNSMYRTQDRIPFNRYFALYSYIFLQ